MARSDPQVNFRIPQELKEKLEQSAKESGRSITSELVTRLEQSFQPTNGIDQDKLITQLIAEVGKLTRQSEEMQRLLKLTSNK